jgi:hypothetical protein
MTLRIFGNVNGNNRQSIATPPTAATSVSTYGPDTDQPDEGTQ